MAKTDLNIGGLDVTNHHTNNNALIANMPVYLPPTSNELALVIADFENGDTTTQLTKNTIGFAFTSGQNTLAATPNGSKGILFRYGPDTAVEDSWQELRYNLNSQHVNTYEKISLYVPSNYKHRRLLELNAVAGDDVSTWAVNDVVVGNDGTSLAKVHSVSGQIVYLKEAENILLKSVWGPSKYDAIPDTPIPVTNSTKSQSATIEFSEGMGANNKISAQWENEYSSNGYFIEVNPADVSTNTDSIPTAKATAADNAQTSNFVSELESVPLISQANDLGANIDFIVYRKRATSPVANDGLVQIWKEINGAYILIFQKSGYGLFSSTNNYFDRGYILGWSNSGFDEQTDIILRGYTFYGDNRPVEITP